MIIDTSGYGLGLNGQMSYQFSSEDVEIPCDANFQALIEPYRDTGNIEFSNRMVCTKWSDS